MVGTLDRFNNGKRSEERDRVRHEVNIPEYLSDNMTNKQKAYNIEVNIDDWRDKQ